MTKKQKLELTWVGKENRPRLEPRILLENPEKSYHAKHRVSDDDIFDNRLIFGDNLLALKALEQEFAGKVKCIYIDPPYNTGSAFEHYDDGLEHSTWLSLISVRLQILWRLLSPEGSFWISIDDYEMPYLRVVMDEIFGRANHIATNVWQKRYSRENREAIGDVHEYIVVYAKSPDFFKRNRNMLELTAEQKKVYKNPTNDPKGPWRTIPITAQAGHATKSQFYTIVGPTGKSFDPPAGNCWRYSKDVFDRMLAEGRIYFGKDGNSQPTTIRYLSEVPGAVPWTWWPHTEVGNTDESKKEMINLFPKIELFDTPKPERLIKRIIHIATNPGDLVLDSFAGSGTTGAVAHKMARRWIMVELGEHCHTHIIPRLKKVIDGEDKGGVTEDCQWQGGGGFRYFKLAPSLLEKDRWGREVISKAYNAEMLAEALCKIEGFTYAPSDSVYWQQGKSTERDFIFVTTQTLSPAQLDALSEEVGEQRTLLVLCAAFRGNTSAWPNLTVKKIPNHIRERCEWGHDDYSLNVENLPKAPPAREAWPPTPKVADSALSRSASQPGLFDSAGDDQ
ncbi:site-specific DNA-methyltransferase [Bradyrhizobium symbiodeficiens]|uniref:site-specific DNA-methyltransferase n=1 Tax=Bradyrhizobium symbiodeficiens TaxID=1404367 RepID=UPI000BA1B05A|nr:site-specific DNA-methyltransferase [Bradyrhizobium symbiodeficiens]AWM10759.1 site-specific DNA-methyltransferase [Bradyrhizobium symbiodeficiens]